jgi:hypothetical protein
MPEHPQQGRHITALVQAAELLRAELAAVVFFAGGHEVDGIRRD